MGGNKYEVAEGRCFPFAMLQTQPGLCSVSLQMASPIQMGLLPCCCFASSDLSKDSSPPFPPLSPVLVTQLLLYSGGSLGGDGGMLRAETILASLTFKSNSWQPGARVGLVLGYE